jgi:predicted N-acyltransferase
MTIKALVYGGVQIGGFAPPKAHKSFDGVWMEMRGSTFTGGKWVPAGLTLEMSQADALDMAMALFLAANDHGEYASKAPANFVKRLAKRMSRKGKT